MATLKNTTINDTGFLQVPVGTTAQRPASPTSGMMRYNNNTYAYEMYNGIQWLNFNVQIVTSDLLAWLDAGNPSSYPGSGSTWTDLSNNNKNGTLVNTSYTSGAGGYFTFNGSTAYGLLPNTTLGNGDVAWTCSAWVRTTTTVNGLGLGSVLSNTSGGPVYSMMGVNAGKIVYWTYYSSDWHQKLGVTTVNNNIWHMLTWVQYTNYTMDMYVDGVLDANVANSTSGNNNPIDMFGASWAGRFDGSIAQILIYTGVSLTPAQVYQNFTAGRKRYGV